MTSARHPAMQPRRSRGFTLLDSVAFSPDGKMLASGGLDNTIILWDVDARQPIGQPLVMGDTGWVTNISFSPDGKMLAAGTGDKNTIILWDVNPESWIHKSCQRVHRNFTRAEWARYFPNEDYRKTCDQWGLEPEPATPTP